MVVSFKRPTTADATNAFMWAALITWVLFLVSENGFAVLGGGIICGLAGYVIVKDTITDGQRRGPGCILVLMAWGMVPAMAITHLVRLFLVSDTQYAPWTVFLSGVLFLIPTMVGLIGGAQ